MNIKRNTLWNLFGSTVPMFIGVAAIPYIYKEIGIERIGILTIIWALIGYFSIFDFGLGRAITQRIAGTTSDHNEQQEMLTATTGVYLTLALGVIGALLGIAAIEIFGMDWMNSNQSLSREIYASIFLACLAVPAATTTAGLRGVLEGKQRFKVVNFLKIFLGTSNFIMPVISIVFFGPNLEYIVVSLVISRYTILFMHWLVVKRKITRYRDNFSLDETRQLFQFGGWMTLSNIISPLMVIADRFLIANVLGASIVAFYTIPAEFLLRVLILPAAITTSLFPVFARYFAEKNYFEALNLYKKSVGFIFLLVGAIATCIMFGAEIAISAWLGLEFAEKSVIVTYILAFGVFFNSIAQVPHAYIQASGDARSTAIIHVVEAALYLPLLLLLLQAYGIRGAAMAWTARALIDLIMLHARAMRLHR